MSYDTREKLERIFRECDKHAERMNSAYAKASSLLPLNAAKYENLSDDEIEHIDQYLFRFSKLQDAMGKRLFKTLLLFLDEDVDEMPFVDILNLLEKLGLLSSVAEWRRLRSLRNELAHQYDDDPEEMSTALNHLFEQKTVIDSMYRRVKRSYTEERRTKATGNQ